MLGGQVIYVLIFLCVILALLLVALIRNVIEVRRVVQENSEEVRTLRLQSRARVSEISYTGNPFEAEEVSLRRLGRASRSRRIVVGGESESELSRDLGRSVDRDGNS